MYSILQAKKTIRDGIKTYLEKDEKGNYIMSEVNCLPFYLEGAPGIGKTQIVGQLAEEMNLGYVSFSLVHHTRNSLLGLPVISELDNGDKYTSYTVSEIIAKVYEQIEKGHKEGILLLDEFPCMSETIMPAMLAFLQTKNIGTHSLPRGWVLVLCGNPAKYNKATHSFDAAVTDRIRKIEVEYKVADFLKYAKENNLSEYIVSYLETNPDHMYRFIKDKQHEELVTCRSWENLSHTITLGEKLDNYIDEELVGQFIKSDEIANKFTLFYQIQVSGMSSEEEQRVLSGNLNDKLIEKYRSLPLNKKWNLAEYLKSNFTKDIDGLSRILNEIEVGKLLIDSIDSANFSKDQLQDGPEDLAAILLSLNGGLNYEYVANEINNVINRRNALMSDMNEKYRCKKMSTEDLTEAISKWCNCELYIDGDKKYLNNLAKKIKKWIDSKEALKRHFEEKNGELIGNIFSFLEKIDETDTLSERFYIEVCNSEALLQIVSSCENEKFNNMCCKHYGMNIA